MHIHIYIYIERERERERVDSAEELGTNMLNAEMLKLLL